MAWWSSGCPPSHGIKNSQGGLIPEVRYRNVPVRCPKDRRGLDGDWENDEWRDGETQSFFETPRQQQVSCRRNAKSGLDLETGAFFEVRAV